MTLRVVMRVVNSMRLKVYDETLKWDLRLERNKKNNEITTYEEESKHKYERGAVKWVELVVFRLTNYVMGYP